MNADVRIASMTDKVERTLQQRQAAAPSGAGAGSWLLDSPRVTATLSLASKIAATPTVPVILSGERGTGVSDLARWIHDHDPGSTCGRFVQTSGHLAVPGEVGVRPLSGTLFVDDVESLRAPSQAWLLNLLLERERRRSPLRIIAGTRMSVPDLLAMPHLSQELVHALDVTRLTIPPLRDHPEEIVPLAYRFLHVCADRVGKSLRGFAVAAEDKLLSHDYPANVRELRNAVERAVVLETSSEVQASSIAFYSEDGPKANQLVVKRVGAGRLPSFAEVERDYLVMLLQQLRGCRAEVSRAMGVSYPTVLKKIARHQLDVRAIVAASELGGRSMLGPADPLFRRGA